MRVFSFAPPYLNVYLEELFYFAPQIIAFVVANVENFSTLARKMDRFCVIFLRFFLEHTQHIVFLVHQVFAYRFSLYCETYVKIMPRKRPDDPRHPRHPDHHAFMQRVAREWDTPNDYSGTSEDEEDMAQTSSKDYDTRSYFPSESK